MVRHADAHPEQIAAGQALLELLTGMEHHQHDLLGGPADRGNGRDVQPFVDLRPPRVVDPGDDDGNVVVLSRHPRGHDVGVVAARHGDEGLGLLDPGLLQGSPLEPDADDLARLDPRGQAVEGRGALVDDRDVVSGPAEFDRERGAHAAAPHQDDLHTAR
jgi:hypothetical protein